MTREISGRIGWEGDEIEALDEDAVRTATRSFREDGVTSIAVCYLFSYANSSHEERTRAIILEEFPEAHVSLSSEVLPRIREWPRLSTTLLNAYLGPVLVNYIADLNKGLDEGGVETQQRFLMQSNGGVMPFEAAVQGGKTVYTLFSGPAAGAQASAYLAGDDAMKGIVTLDMGGTSADIAFIEGGTPLEVTEVMLARRPLGVPALDMTTISAGGGSIAWVDKGGFLCVGPHSAGADPGPACYGKGGDEPAVTDADIVLGYLNPDYFLGGSQTLDGRGIRKGAPGKGRRAARYVDPRGRSRHSPYCRSAYGGRGQGIRGEARCEPAGIHPAAVRRRGRGACRFGRGRAGHQPDFRSAAAGGFFRARAALHGRGARLCEIRTASDGAGDAGPRRSGVLRARSARSR